MKTIDEHFRDWENHAFGFGYGTGEYPILEALRIFFENVGVDSAYPHCYNSTVIETALGKTVTWLLINRLCQVDIIDYGTSPRSGWLSPEGMRLGAYFLSKRTIELYEACMGESEDYIHCSPYYCNCGPKGTDATSDCQNPFWVKRIR